MLFLAFHSAQCVSTLSTSYLVCKGKFYLFSKGRIFGFVRVSLDSK